MNRAIRQFDRVLRTVFAQGRSTCSFGDDLPEATLPGVQRRHAAALMRVDHCGEVCAQALYQGQSLTAGDPALAAALQRAADEETDHLAWTEMRLKELGGSRSVLNPLWYAGAFAMGALAGRAGRAWNLAFVVETERQVEAHLNDHLERLPASDSKSRSILERMKADEIRHGQTATALGARQMPPAIRFAMKMAAQVMTRTTYWI